VRLGIPEINEHPVAHVLGYEAVEPSDRLRDALVIRADYRTQILWVELGRERGRADEVGEHHGQLAPLCVILSSRLGWHGSRGCRCGKLLDSSKHYPPMSEQHTDVFEVLIGQMAECCKTNAVFSKTLGVIGHAELLEPVRNLLHRGYQRPIGT
jgi:hypothetical protein